MKSKTVATVFAALIVVQSFLSGCSSPDDQARAYYEKGQALLEAGDDVKAGLEFRNALQVKSNLAPALFGLAVIAERKGDFQATFRHLTKAIEADPKHVDALAKRAGLLLAAGQLDQAHAESAAVLELAPDNASVRALRAAVLLRVEDRNGAVDQANAALQRDAANAPALMVLATERLSAEDPARAMEYLDRGLAKDPRSVPLRLLKIRALEKEGRAGDIEAELRLLIEQNPTSKGFREALARYYSQAGRMAEAEAELRAIAAANPAELAPKLDVIRFINTTKGFDVAESEFKALIGKEPSNYDLRLALSQFYLANNRRAAAEEVLRNVVTEQGAGKPALQARVVLASLQLGAGDKEAAGKLIAEVLRADEKNADALLLRAGMAMERGALDDAIADLHTVLRDDPNSARVLLMLAKAHDRAGSTDLAEDNYFRAYEAARGQVAIGLEFAQFLAKHAKLQRAEDVLESVVAASPKDVRALTALANVRIARGDGAGAEEVARAISEVGVSEQVYEQVLGAALAAQGKGEESIEALQRAHKAAPKASQPILALVRAYERANKPDEAEKFLRSVLAQQSDSQVARLRLGQLQLSQGKADAAEQTFRDAIARAPKDASGYRALAALQARQGKLDAVLATIEQGLAQVPGDFALRLTRAGIYQGQGKVDAAIAEYEGMLKDRPDAQVAANNLAALLADHRTDAASRKRALQLAEPLKASTIPHFQDTLGWVHYRLGEYDQAITVLRKAADGAPNVAVFHYHLGMAYLANKDKAGAKRSLEKALELSAKQPLAQDKEIRETLAGLQ
jgi:putative PEP-CTERM system TPR-repeat lipoprotein